MKAMFLLTSRQFVRGGARTWFTWICAVICTGLIGAVLFGGESLAASFSQRSDLAQQVLLLSRLVLGSLILGLAILLRSIFRLSLSQRTRMLGQMASLGATRRQLRQSVWMDALILAGCSIPLGLVASAAGLAVVFSVLKSWTQLNARPLTLLVRPQHVLLAAACVLVTLLLAAWGPAREASRLTPIEAVRESCALPKRRGRVRFKNVEKLLAVRSISAYRERSSQTAVIAVCVFLVMLTLGFSEGMVRSYEDSVPEYSYRVYCWVRGGDEPAELDRLVRNAAANVTDSRVYSSEDTGLIWPVGDSMAKVLTLDDQAFEEWYGAPLPAAEEGTLSCVYASDGQQEPSFNIGQTAQGGDCVVTDFCSNPLPAGLQEENGFSTQYLITTQSAYDAFPGKLQRAECLLQILVETQDAAQLTPAVTQALAERAVQDDGHDLVGSDVTAYVIQDFTRSSRNYAATEAAIDLLRICCGGFAVLLAVGCTASVLSAVSAQAQMRRREFALLRSAGMTQTGIRRTLGIEARNRFVWGLGLGLPLGIGAYYFLEKQMISFFNFHWLACLAESCKTGLVVAVCAGAVCWAANRIALNAALHASVRDDLVRE